MITVGELLGGAVCDLEPYASERGVRLEPRAEGFALTLGDSHKLRQALIRLLQSAIERSCPGSLVQARAAVRGGRAVVLVEDESALPLAAGHVGLSIARAIIERHGGTLSIDHVDGFGASVRAEFPCLDGEAP